jgi:hypothetical protein
MGADIKPYTSYAPQPLRIRLGGPRNNHGDNAVTYAGITYKDFAVRGTKKNRTPVCGNVTPPDGGACTPVPIVEDGYAMIGNTPSNQELAVESDDNGSVGSVAYLRFASIEGKPSKAVLRMHTLNQSSAGGNAGQICRVDDDAWSAAQLTWETRPVVSMACVGPAGPVGVDQEVEWDVTGIVPSTGRVNLAALSTVSDGVHYYSTESSATLGPRLCVEGVVPVVPDAGGSESGTVDSGSKDSSLDGALDASGGNPDAGRKGLAGADDEGGCGCRSAGGGRSGMALLLPIALWALRRRRTRAREA